jgi:hypothetical protein
MPLLAARATPPPATATPIAAAATLTDTNFARADITIGSPSCERYASM